MQLHFEGFTLDTDRYELRRGEERLAVEPQVFDLLVYLVKNRERVIDQDELLRTVWGGRIVSLSTLTSRINAARAALGDSGAEQKLIKTIPRKGYRFIGKLDQPPVEQRQLRQDIHFCTTQDGARIAYSTVGGGPPVVKAGNWLNHLEYDWESPIWSPLLHWLAERHLLVRYDARGNGLSDWNVADVSSDAFVRDLEAVVEATGLERFSLFGVSQGVAVCIAYAVRHPERVEKLVLYGGFALGRRLRGDAADIEQAEAMVTLMRTGWGQENPAFRQVFTSLFVPGGSPEQMSWFNDLQRKTTSAENAVRMRLVSDTMNVVDLLPQVRAPTLVLHCRDDAVQPFDEGRRLAAAIPGAHFVPLEGRNHLILDTDPGWPRFREAVEAFLAA